MIPEAPANRGWTRRQTADQRADSNGSCAAAASQPQYVMPASSVNRLDSTTTGLDDT
jgi:hypothetical protein